MTPPVYDTAASPEPIAARSSAPVGVGPLGVSRPRAVGRRDRTDRRTWRAARGILWLALAVQAGWFLLNGLVLHHAPGLDAIGVSIACGVAAFAVGSQRWTWLAVLLRTIMAADFLLAVADRFGFLGAYGSPGVSWGDFGHFVHYTGTLAAFLAARLAPTLAVAATAAEITLGVALLLGLRLRLAALGAAALLAVYGISMSISLPPAQQFHYSVFLLCAAMLNLSRLDSTFTVDRVLARAGDEDG